MDLKEIVDKYSLLKKRLENPLVPGPAIQLQVDRRKAIAHQLPMVARDYKHGFRSSLSIVLLVGSTAKELGEAIENKAAGSLVYNGNGLFDEIMDSLPVEAKNGRMSPKHVIDLVGSHFEEIARDIDVMAYPQFVYKHKNGATIATEADTYELVKRVMIENLGSKVMLEFNVATAAQKSLDAGFSGKKIPLFLYTSDVSVANEYSKDYKTITLTSGEVNGKLTQSAFSSLDKLDDENVEKTLNKLKKELSKK